MTDRAGWELDDPDLWYKLYVATHDEGKKIFLQHPSTDSTGVGPAFEYREVSGGHKLGHQLNMGVKAVAMAWSPEGQKAVTRFSLPGYQYVTLDEFIGQCQIIAKSIKEPKAKAGEYVLTDEYRLNKAGRIAFWIRSRD